MACAHTYVKVKTKLFPREQFYFDLLQAAKEFEPFTDLVILVSSHLGS